MAGFPWKNRWTPKFLSLSPVMRRPVLLLPLVCIAARLLFVFSNGPEQHKASLGRGGNDDASIGDGGVLAHVE